MGWWVIQVKTCDPLSTCCTHRHIHMYVNRPEIIMYVSFKQTSNNVIKCDWILEN